MLVQFSSTPSFSQLWRARSRASMWAMVVSENPQLPLTSAANSRQLAFTRWVDQKCHIGVRVKIDKTGAHHTATDVQHLCALPIAIAHPRDLVPRNPEITHNLPAAVAVNY